MKVIILSSLFIALISCNNKTIFKQKNISKIKALHNPSFGKIEVKNAKYDIKDLFINLEKVHYNPYLYNSKENIAQFIDSIENGWGNIDSIPKASFILDLMKIMAQINDGHTNILWYSDKVILNQDSSIFFPLRLSLTNEKLIVINDTSHTYKGKTVSYINGISANYLFEDAMKHLGGTELFIQAMNETIFFPIYLHLKGIAPPYKITTYDEGYFEIKDGIPMKSIYQRLNKSKKNYEFELINNNIGLISYNSCNDYEMFKTFLKETFQYIKTNKIDKLIIDIRNNGGGNSSLNDLLIPYLSDKLYRQSSRRLWKISDVSIDFLESMGVKEYYGKDYLEKYRTKNDSTILDFGLVEPYTDDKPKYAFEGKSCILIGPKTFSSANMLADAVSVYNLTTLIGLPTGELTNDFGEQQTSKLSNSEIPYSFTIAFDIGANNNEKSHHTVEPDILTNEDALDFAIKWLMSDK